jgi:hypothetical protein
MNPPLPWFGGKRAIAAEVWDRFGSPAVYVEPFFGMGAVFKLEGWEEFKWEPIGGFENQGGGGKRQESIWFSPACRELPIFEFLKRPK